MYGLIGEKLGHSYSPQIHSMILESINKRGCYNLFEVEKGMLKESVKALKTLKAKGINVTIPYKVDIMDCLDEISLEAKNIGAVNTIKFEDEKCIGYNTDYYGFGMMLDANNVSVTDKIVVILGTGGASKAVGQYVKDNNAKEIFFVTRSKRNKEYENEKLIEYNDLQDLKGDIIINCTPCGMYPNVYESPVSEEQIDKFKVAVDLIYNPEETVFLKMAKNKGLKIINGLYMLVGQAIKAQEIWNNVTVNKGLLIQISKNINKK